MEVPTSSLAQPKGTFIGGSVSSCQCSFQGGGCTSSPSHQLPSISTSGLSWLSRLCQFGRWWIASQCIQACNFLIMSIAALFFPQVLSAIYTFFSIYKIMITTTIMVNIDGGTYTSQGCYRHLIYAFQQCCIVGTVMIPVYKWRNWGLENGRDLPRVSQQQAARPAWIQASLTTKPTFLNTRHLHLRLNKHNRSRDPGALTLGLSPRDSKGITCWGSLTLLPLFEVNVSLGSCFLLRCARRGPQRWDPDWSLPEVHPCERSEWATAGDTSSQIATSGLRVRRKYKVHSFSKYLLNIYYVPGSVPQTQTHGSEQDKLGLCSHETYVRQKINKKQNDSVR